MKRIRCWLVGVWECADNTLTRKPRTALPNNALRLVHRLRALRQQQTETLLDDQSLARVLVLGREAGRMRGDGRLAHLRVFLFFFEDK